MNAKEPLPIIADQDYGAFEPLVVVPGENYGLFRPLVQLACNPFDLTPAVPGPAVNCEGGGPELVQGCGGAAENPPGAGGATPPFDGATPYGGLGAPSPPRRQFIDRFFSTPFLSNLYRFSPTGWFDNEGWLHCSGIRDNFVYLRPGDLMFVWAFVIPPDQTVNNPTSEIVKVPVPPGYYPVSEIRGN